MPKIDFYILPDSTLTARLNFACRLIEKAYQQNHRVYIHTTNSNEANQLDQLLWTYRDESFIPHNLYSNEQTQQPHIQIGFDKIPEKHSDILINLSGELPSFYQTFSRVLEIIPNDPAEQTHGRERYRIYRNAGHEVVTHKI